MAERNLEQISKQEKPSTSSKSRIIGSRCVVWGCGTLSAEGYGMFTWPKDIKLSSIWTKRVQITRADFLGPGNVGSKNPIICGKHFEKACFLQSCLLKKEMGIKVTMRLKEDAVPSIFPKKETVTKPPPESEETPVKKRKSGGAYEKRERKRVISEMMVAKLVENIPAEATISEEHTIDDDRITSVGIQTDEQPPAAKPKKQSNKHIHVRSKGVQIKIHCGRTAYTQTPSRVMCDSATQYEIEPSVTVDRASQCNFLSPVSCIEEVEEDELPEPEDCKDVDWTPDRLETAKDYSESDTDEETEIPLHLEDVKPFAETKVLVFLSCLLMLFQICQGCMEKAPGYIRRMVGSYIQIQQFCRKCGFVRKWCSQPFIGKYPAGNLSISAAILFSGSSCSKALRMCDIMNLKTITTRTFHNHQRKFLQPSIHNVWHQHQTELIQKIKETDASLITGGDGRCDSPGHCAKFGCYTVQDLKESKILAIQLVQSNEVKSSFHMELDGLKRCLAFLEEMGLNLAVLVTDRHVSIAKWLRENKATVDHRYDVWHVGKNIKKKLEKIAREKHGDLIKDWIQSIINHLYWSACSTDDGNGDVICAKWMSILNHLQNKHTDHGSLFPKCSHGELPRLAQRRKKWITADSVPALKLEKILVKPILLRDIKKLSHHYQTYGLEVFHSLVNQFAPKMYAYSFAGQYSRLHLAALHFNENSDRDAARTASGDIVYKLKYPKAKRGGYVVRACKEESTYDYIDKLLTEVERLSTHNIRIELSQLIYIPPPLSSTIEKPEKLEAVKQIVSRYRKQ